MDYVSLDEALALHAEIKGISPQAAQDHVHRMDLLESALERPRNAAHYEDADLALQSATLLWGLVRNHPFTDGNKRTAWVVTRTFLRMNGHDLRMSEQRKYDLVIGVANARPSVQRVAGTFRRAIRPLSADRASAQQR